MLPHFLHYFFSLELCSLKGFCVSVPCLWHGTDVGFRGQLVGVLGNQTQVVRFGGRCLYLVFILLDLLIFHLNHFNCQIMIGCEN